MSSCVLYLTKNDSVALFKYDMQLRDNIGAEVSNWCSLFVEGDNDKSKILNPFWTNNQRSSEPSTIFIRLSATPNFFIKRVGQNVSTLAEWSDMPKGKRFNGGVLVVLKGVKVDRHSGTIAPLVVVEQVQRVEEDQRSLAKLDIQMTTCELDDDNNDDECIDLTT